MHASLNPPAAKAMIDLEAICNTYGHGLVAVARCRGRRDGFALLLTWSDETIAHRVEGVQPALVQVTTRVGPLLRIPAGTDFDAVGLRSSNAETRVGVLPLEFSNSVLVRKPNQVVTLAGQATPALHVSVEHSVIDVTSLDDVDEGATIHLISCDRNRGPLQTEVSRVQGRPSVELLVSMTGKVPYEHRELVSSWACRA
jgi:hypothetical protein